MQKCGSKKQKKYCPHKKATNRGMLSKLLNQMEAIFSSCTE